MSSLSDSVDRICLLAKNIRLNAANCASETAGPFTKAVLHAPLGDLIRDIDPAELGLFTLVAPSKQVPDVDNAGASTSEITRAEFHGATPLKKPPVPKPGRHNPQRPGEHEPEVYARAAIKYLDRYQSIRPMPRAAEQATRITEHLDVVRESMRKLNDELKQHATADACSPPASPKATIRQEEKRIREAQARIRELRKRKDVLLKQKASARIAPPKARPNLQTPPPADAQEETFWNTPAASARTLHFTGESLLDEHVDVGDISGVSFASPLPVRGSIQSLPRLAVAEDDEPETQLVPDIAELESMDDGESMGSVDGSPEDEVEEEQTVVMHQPPPGGAVDVPDELAEAALQPASEPPPVAETHGVARSSKVRVTTELEHISKIWATVGELIMPGHSFDITGSSGSKPPRAKETIAHLRTLSSVTPAPASPTASLSSFNNTASSASAGASGQPTAQQVLTGYMLLTLLSAPPAYAMPLTQLKEALSAKTAELGVSAVTAIGGSGVTRPIYGCVAKRLVKIDRSGGGQVVKFDV